MIKGIIIKQQYNDAEKTKALMEKMVKHLEMCIYDPLLEGMTFLPTDGIDFIVSSPGPVDEEILTEQFLPFIKHTIDRKADYLTIKKRKEVLFVDRNSIIGIEVMGKHCYIHTVDNEYVITRITLHDLIDLLEEPMLIRCHKSFAVNTKHISGMIREGRNRWRPIFNVDTTFECYVSDRHVESVAELLREKTKSSREIYVNWQQEE